MSIYDILHEQYLKETLMSLKKSSYSGQGHRMALNSSP